MDMMQVTQEEAMLFGYYTNYKNTRSLRAIVPLMFFIGNTAWHPKTQWLVRAIDLGKQEERTFALASFEFMSIDQYAHRKAEQEKRNEK